MGLRRALKEEKVPAETVTVLLSRKFHAVVNDAREKKNFEEFKRGKFTKHGRMAAGDVKSPK